MASKPKAVPAFVPRGPVRITLPAAVAYDLKSLQKSLVNLADQLGCRPCFSGADCTFLLERDFVINEKGEVGTAVNQIQNVALVQGPTPHPWRSGPLPDPWLAALAEPIPYPSHRVTARISGSVSYNIDALQKAVANVAGKLGHPMCFSGFDITFLHERELIINV